MDIKQPRRILLLGPPDAGILPLLKDLTGTAPPPQRADESIAGSSHSWQIKTAYYSAIVPIWIDEVVDIDAWSADFGTAEAKEVVMAVGAWIYVFRRPVSEHDYDSIKKALSAIQEVIEKAAGYAWDGTCLAVCTAQSTTPYLEKSSDEWDDVCREYGFEYVDSEAKGKNEYGEATGPERIREAIEATDWNDDEGGELDGLDDLDGDGNEQFAGTFAAEEAETSLELLGMKEAVAGHDHGDPAEEGQKVEEVERMMSRLMAVKDTASALPEEERKRFARRAVNDMMKSMEL